MFSVELVSTCDSSYRDQAKEINYGRPLQTERLEQRNGLPPSSFSAFSIDPDYSVLTSRRVRENCSSFVSTQWRLPIIGFIDRSYNAAIVDRRQIVINVSLTAIDASNK